MVDHDIMVEMGKRKHYTGYLEVVSSKLPSTIKERFFDICDDYAKLYQNPAKYTPSKIIQALIMEYNEGHVDMMKIIGSKLDLIMEIEKSRKEELQRRRESAKVFHQDARRVRLPRDMRF